MIEWIYEPYVGRDHAFLKGLFRYLTNSQYRIAARVRHVMHCSGVLAKFYSDRLMSKYSIHISPSAQSGKNLRILHPIGVVIGSGVVIGDNCTIYQNVTLGQNRNGYPVLGNDVIVYANAVIVGNIKIGNGAIVGAGSVVVDDVPDGAIVAGSPARTIRYRNPERDKGLY